MSERLSDNRKSKCWPRLREALARAVPIRMWAVARAFYELAAIEARRSINWAASSLAFIATLALLIGASLGPQLGLYGIQADGDVDDWHGVFKGRSFLDPAERPRLAETSYEFSVAARLKKKQERAIRDFAQVDSFDSIYRLLSSKEAITLNSVKSLLPLADRAKDPTASIQARSPDVIGIAGDPPPQAMALLSNAELARVESFDGSFKDSAEKFIYKRGLDKDRIVVAITFGSKAGSSERRAKILIEKPEGGDNAAYFGVRLWATTWMANTLDLEKVDRAQKSGLSVADTEPHPFTISLSRDAKMERPRPTSKDISARVTSFAMLLVALGSALAGVFQSWKLSKRIASGELSFHAQSFLPAWVLTGSSVSGFAAAAIAPVGAAIGAALLISSLFDGGLGLPLAASGTIACVLSIATTCSFQLLGCVFFPPGAAQRIVETAMSFALGLGVTVSCLVVFGQRQGSSTIAAGWLGEVVAGGESALGAAAALIGCAALAIIAAHARIGRFERRSLGDKL